MQVLCKPAGLLGLGQPTVYMTHSITVDLTAALYQDSICTDQFETFRSIASSCNKLAKFMH